MKAYRLLLLLLCLQPLLVLSQAKPKAPAPKTSQADRMMEQMLKKAGIDGEDAKLVKEMMKSVPAQTAYVPKQSSDGITDNKTLIPPRNAAAIAAIPTRALADADMKPMATAMYNQMMPKLPADQRGIIQRALQVATDADAMSGASFTALLQGQYYVALAMALKAVATEPADPVNQNNLGSVLTQTGYPEKAIPILQKLERQFPANSTVLNNLGQAWLKLGETSKAEEFLSRAVAANPQHSEAAIGLGLVKEAKGDRGGAEKLYLQSFTELPGALSERLIRNVNPGYANLWHGRGTAGDIQTRHRMSGPMNGEPETNPIEFNEPEYLVGRLDINRMKKVLTSYNYFKSPWDEVVETENDVKSYRTNSCKREMQIEWFGKLGDTVQSWLDKLHVKADERHESEDLSTMISRNVTAVMEGHLMMRPATYITMALQVEIAKWSEEYGNEREQLKSAIRSLYQPVLLLQKQKDPKCAQIDQAANEFMAEANPLVYRFHRRKLAEFRDWMNLMCTWIFYLPSGDEDLALKKCLSWTQTFIGLHYNALEDLQLLDSYCPASGGQGRLTLAEGCVFLEPDMVPQLLCPTVVYMPADIDLLRLGINTQNFDDNAFGIPHSRINAMPNMSVAYSDGDGIGEPGKDPTIKTTDGFLLPATQSAEPKPETPGESGLTTSASTANPNPYTARNLLRRALQRDCSQLRSNRERYRNAMKRKKFTLKGGSVEVELLDENGNPVPFDDEARPPRRLVGGEVTAELIDPGPSIEALTLRTRIHNAISAGINAVSNISNFIKGLFQ